MKIIFSKIVEIILNCFILKVNKESSFLVSLPHHNGILIDPFQLLKSTNDHLF